MDVINANAEMQVENVELIERVDIENSPFEVIGIDGKWFGAMGQYRLTETYEDKEKCIKELQEFSWNRVVQVMMLLNEKLNVNDLLKDKE